MTTPRFLIKDIKTPFLTGDNYKKALSVLRMKRGDELFVFDVSGREWKAKIKDIKKDKIILELFEEVFKETELSFSLTLIQGILKPNKMEIVIEKATELGVTKIIPLIAKRSVVKSPSEGKLKRWEKIVTSACIQCGRSIVPTLEKPIRISDLKSDIDGEKIIFWEGSKRSIKEVLKERKEKDVYIIIGPEGGFEDYEVKIANSKGFLDASLGKRTLRAETASIVALTTIIYELGGFDL